MILGIGIDLLEFEQLNIANEQLVKKILTHNEYQLFLQKKTEQQKKEFFGGRFSAKEAFVKAIGTGFRDIGFHDIEILNDALGAPKLTTTFNFLQIPTYIHLSISHSTQAVTAMVVIEQ